MFKFNCELDRRKGSIASYSRPRHFFRKELFIINDVYALFCSIFLWKRIKQFLRRSKSCDHLVRKFQFAYLTFSHILCTMFSNRCFDIDGADNIPIIFNVVNSNEIAIISGLLRKKSAS